MTSGTKSEPQTAWRRIANYIRELQYMQHVPYRLAFALPTRYMYIVLGHP